MSGAAAASHTATGSTDLQEHDRLPKDFFCPITLDVMEDPVTAADGVTYERTAIEAWMARKGAVGIYRTPLTSRELHTNRALKVAIEFHTQQAGEVASLQNDARDLKECLRALEGDLKHAASKNANKVDHVDYLRVCNENKFLQSKVSRLEAELATMKSSSRAAASRIHEDRLGHEEKTALTGQLSPILGESGSQDLDLPQSGLPALHNIISSTISKDRAEAESVKQSHEAQATRCQAELDDANRRAREMGDHAQKEEEEIMGAEAAVKQGRESLSSLHEQLQEQLRERDSVGEKYADEWNRLRGTCAGLDPKADLQAVQDSPYEERGGKLEEYAACHRKALELQQKHKNVKETISEHEKCLQRRRKEVQALWNQQKAEQELARKFEQEQQEQEAVAQASVSKKRKLTAQEATFHDQARSLCSTCGPFAQGHATEANLMICALMDTSLAKRFKAFERVMFKALPDESLARLLSSGDITVKAALADFGYDARVVMTCVKGLYPNQGVQAEACLRALVDYGACIRHLLDAGFGIQHLISAGVKLEQLIANDVKLDQLLANCVEVKQLLSGGCSHLQVHCSTPSALRAPRTGRSSARDIDA